MSKYKRLLVGLGMCVCQLTASGANVEIEKTTGVVGGDKIPVGTGISIYIRLNNDFPDTIRQIANAFRIYSPDGANWYPHAFVDTAISLNRDLVIDTTYYVRWTDSTSEYGQDWTEFFEPTEATSFWHPALGGGSDTAEFWAYDFCLCSGLIPQQSIVPWLIRIDSVSAASIGSTICIDSSGFAVAPSVWFNGGEHFPTWDGPYCFEIVADCCEELRGNINLDWQDTIDISDLTYLVGWMFKSGAAPPCMFEADVDGNDSHDIADVTSLVGYMFKGGVAPAGCP